MSEQREQQRASLVVPLTHLLQLNVSGRDYRIPKALVDQKRHRRNEQGSTLLELISQTQTLEDKEQLCDFYDQASDIFYFYGRNAAIFEKVLMYQSSGILHASKQICNIELCSELEFWRVPKDAVMQCSCTADSLGHSSHSHVDSIAPEEPTMSIMSEAEHDGIPLMHITNGNSNNYISVACADEEEKQAKPARPPTKEEIEQARKMAVYDTVRYGVFRRKLWLFMEDYTTSCAAKGFAVVSVTFALVSIITMIVGTIPAFEVDNIGTGERVPHYSLIIVDHVCITYFAIEYLTRLITTPERWAYVKETMSIIDILAILPSLLDIIFDQFEININKLGGIKGAFLALRLLRVLRVFRVFRLARYHSGLQQLGETLKASQKEISVLGVFFTSLVLLFATTVYYLEKDVPGTPFVSIPAACWWCVITITTVGYGDLVPVTPGGQLVATVACLAGIIVLAFPITMIIENFNEKYRGAEEQQAPAPGDEPKKKIKRLKM